MHRLPPIVPLQGKFLWWNRSYRAHGYKSILMRECKYEFYVFKRKLHRTLFKVLVHPCVLTFPDDSGQLNWFIFHSCIHEFLLKCAFTMEECFSNCFPLFPQLSQTNTVLKESCFGLRAAQSYLKNLSHNIFKFSCRSCCFSPDSILNLKYLKRGWERTCCI